MVSRRRGLALLLAAVLAGGIASAASAQRRLTVVQVHLTSPVSPGSDATLTVQTLPGAGCTITVHYKSGPSRAHGLVPKTADRQGLVSWTWRVGTRTTPGTWPIVVRCVLGSSEGTLETSFEVRGGTP